MIFLVCLLLPASLLCSCCFSIMFLVFLQWLVYLPLLALMFYLASLLLLLFHDVPGMSAVPCIPSVANTPATAIASMPLVLVCDVPRTSAVDGFPSVAKTSAVATSLSLFLVSDVRGMSVFVISLLLLTPLLWLSSLLLFLVQDVPGMSAVACVTSVAYSPAVAGVPAAISWP